MENFGEYTVRGEVRRFKAFDTLNYDTAYLVGYLACDGSYVSGKNNRGYDFMAVATKDLYILEQFKDMYCPDMTIYFLGKKSSAKVNAINDVWELRFPRKMNESFDKFGIFKYKLNRRVVGVSNTNFPAYFAGCVDSDGFISVKHRKDCRTPRLTCYITHQSMQYLCDLQSRLVYFGVNSSIRPHGAGAYRLSLQNTEQNKVFFNLVNTFIHNRKRKLILTTYLNTYYFVPQASGELLESVMPISSQAQDTSCEGSETTGEV